MPPLDIAVSIFNPRRFASRYRLYREFAARLAPLRGVRLHTVEIAFGGRPFEVTTPGDPFALQLRTDTELWHKERALNLLFAQIIRECPDCEYIAWVDPDVSFLHPDWAGETVHALQHYAVVQMFSEAINLGPSAEVLWSAPALLRAWQDSDRTHWQNPRAVAYGRKDHPGLAWAARRDALEAMGGLLDICIAGSADLHMAGAFMGNYLLGHPSNLAPGYHDCLLRWARRADECVRGNVGVVPGAVAHHWHGRTRQRGYDRRWEIMARHQFDPLLDLKTDLQGLHQFTARNRQLARDIRRSLASRNEDVNEV